MPLEVIENEKSRDDILGSFFKPHIHGCYGDLSVRDFHTLANPQECLGTARHSDARNNDCRLGGLFSGIPGNSVSWVCPPERAVKAAPRGSHAPGEISAKYAG